MSGKDLVVAIREAMPEIKRGSLVVFGDIFGGRIDNIHRVVGATMEPDGAAAVAFDQGETLTIWDAQDVTVTACEFRIDHASRVRWEWFYYGREHRAENRYCWEHRVIGDQVEATSNVDWYTPTFTPSLAKAAVELVGAFQA